MNESPREEIQLEEHRVPRWITALWLTFVVSLGLASVVVGFRSNHDFVRTLGFLAASGILIFMLSVVAYLALYGLSVLLEGLDYHKTHCDDSKHRAGMGDFMR